MLHSRLLDWDLSGDLIVASSLKELAGKGCAFVEKECFVVNNCKKIWRRRLILVFYLLFFK